nr:unknown [Medicago truncatula]
MQKQGKAEKPKKMPASKAKASSKVVSKESVDDLKKDSEPEECCKVEAVSVITESEGSEGSSPLSDLTFGDVGEPQWEGDSENFNLLKYPSYEIDWDSL